jgi:hypothetical protein
VFGGYNILQGICSYATEYTAQMAPVRDFLSCYAEAQTILLLNRYL